jgi:transposase
MLPSTLAQDLLGSELKFLSSKAYRGGHIWDVKKARREFEICPKCASPSKIRCGRLRVIVREESIRQTALWFRVHKHRYFCRPCKKPFAEPTPGVWPRRRTTQRFRRALAKACEDLTDLSRVRKYYQVSSGLIYKVFYDQLDIKLRSRSNQPWPKIIGIDEHFFRRKNHRTEFVTVITNMTKRRLFEVAYGKDTKTLFEQLKGIPGRENVSIVVMDMSDTYRAVVKLLFPNAQIVADKFHVLRLMSPALIKLRAQIHGHRKELQYRRLILRNERNLDYETRTELWRYLEQHPKLQELHRWKERLHEFYRTKGVRRATQSLERLLRDLENSLLPEAQRLKKTLKHWKDALLLYFEKRYTNGLTEALNGRAKLLQRRASGYRSFKNYRLRLLSACGF